MAMFLRLWDLAKGIAHDSASNAIERERHGLFIAGKLVLAVAALAAAPLYFALVGPPGGLEAVALVFALTPLAAVLAASRTGDLVGSAGLGVAGLIGFSLAASFSAPGVAGAAAALLVAAPVQAAIAGSIPLVGAAIAGSLAAALLCASVAAGAPASPIPVALIACLAIAYAGGLCAGLLRLAAMRRNAGETARADFDGLTGLLQDLVLQLDRTGAVVANSSGAGERLAGLSVRDLSGRGLFERVHVADRPLFLKSVSDAASSEGHVQADIRVRAGGEDGDSVWFASVRLRLARIGGAGDVRLIAVLRDVSEELGHAQELAAARAEAQQSGASKDRFLANISHELRTPLNAIIGFSEILGSDMMPLDAARRCEYANIINASGQHLLSVVNSILDISKIEAGSFQITPEPFELAPLIDQCCDMVRLKADEGGVELRRETPAHMPDIIADKRAVKQILINLVSNAVKFTAAGGHVTIRARLAGSGIAIDIEDDGIGVLARDLVRLGDPFFQAKDSYDRPYEGTGLGLSVVRGLVGLHGGVVRIESAQGEGTRVTITMPLDCRIVSDQARARVARIETLASGPFPDRLSDRLPEQKVKQIA
ncbi:MAG: PAS domain-containing sensor histidine kinase [Beijerinckiaceae bacterium]|nr:PAS domain-containing sensor histidine kinase [Beijerinckiaceae bacterium]